MHITDAGLIDQATLSPTGIFYLVAVEQNRPNDLLDRLRARGLQAEVRRMDLLVEVRVELIRSRSRSSDAQAESYYMSSRLIDDNPTLDRKSRAQSCA